MLAAHLLTLPAGDVADPATWGDVVNGRSSILFATLAGVSVGLVTGGRDRPARGPVLGLARRRIAVRAVLLWLLGLGLIATNVPVFVILPTYALLFLLALPLLRLRARSLWLLAAALAVVMPWILPSLDALPVWAGESGETLSLIVGWHYPAPVWAAFLVAGLAAARSDLASARTVRTMLLGGAAAAIVAYGAAALADASPFADDPGGLLTTVLTARAHSSGLFEVVGGGGVALSVLALCLLACRWAPVTAVTLPVRAVGSMPLTAYAGQILVWALVAQLALADVRDLAGMRDLQTFWPFVVGTLVFCTVWALRWGRGPLERLLSLLTRWVLRA